MLSKYTFFIQSMSESIFHDTKNFIEYHEIAFNNNYNNSL